MAIDFTLVLKERLVSPENPGPTNVIDPGYCGIGILICAMLLKEKGSHLLYVPMAIMLVMLFLTQSRGPIIALLVAFVCTLHLHVFTRRNLLIVAALRWFWARFSSLRRWETCCWRALKSWAPKADCA
jgi:hypothetical protein